MNDASAHIVVSGLVQGVGYRYFTARNAEGLGVTGFVRNLPDGRVEIFANGERGRISDFVAVLKVGPRASRVTDVALDWVASKETFDRFEVR
jgi:acylphosphatase